MLYVYEWVWNVCVLSMKSWHLAFKTLANVAFEGFSSLCVCAHFTHTFLFQRAHWEHLSPYSHIHTHTWLCAKQSAYWLIILWKPFHSYQVNMLPKIPSPHWLCSLYLLPKSQIALVESWDNTWALVLTQTWDVNMAELLFRWDVLHVQQCYFKNTATEQEWQKNKTTVWNVLLSVIETMQTCCSSRFTMLNSDPMPTSF